MIKNHTNTRCSEPPVKDRSKKEKLSKLFYNRGAKRGAFMLSHCRMGRFNKSFSKSYCAPGIYKQPVNYYL